MDTAIGAHNEADSNLQARVTVLKDGIRGGEGFGRMSSFTARPRGSVGHVREFGVTDRRLP